MRLHPPPKNRTRQRTCQFCFAKRGIWRRMVNARTHVLGEYMCDDCYEARRRQAMATSRYFADK